MDEEALTEALMEEERRTMSTRMFHPVSLNDHNGLPERSIEDVAADDRRDMYRLDKISHVAHNVDTEIAMDLHPRIVPYVQRVGLLPFARLTDYCWFKVDEPLISTFIEKWRPETHSFHMLWGECTVTL
ncbi:hypothetical protein PIB30_017195 [Stylosanthes scabra]|uniref:Aminotransferase-like plant mobile domain-containing protein n=1 Tax=Stylosanthes scabra TaxID=79078 RepID=A0ABU6X6S3_9FABA|nr:hypothetical protein [Stylosanthes scabra]